MRNIFHITALLLEPHPSTDSEAKEKTQYYRSAISRLVILKSIQAKVPPMVIKMVISKRSIKLEYPLLVCMFLLTL
jgi:hypothetical protein